MSDAADSEHSGAAALRRHDVDLVPDRSRPEVFGSALGLVEDALLAADSMAEVYDAVVEGARIIAGGETAVLNLVEERSESLITVAATGRRADRFLGFRMPRVSSLSGRVVATGVSAIVGSAR